MTWPYDVAIPLLKDVQSQAPQAICEITPLNASRNLIINRDRSRPSTIRRSGARWR